MCHAPNTNYACLFLSNKYTAIHSPVKRFSLSTVFFYWTQMNTELKRIAVVGAAGQKGSSIVEALLEYPDQWIVRGIVRDRSLPFSQVE